MTSKPGAEVLSGVPMCKKAVMCLIEEIPTSDKFCNSVAGPELSVTESTICMH